MIEKNWLLLKELELLVHCGEKGADEYIKTKYNVPGNSSEEILINASELSKKLGGIQQQKELEKIGRAHV